MLAFLCKMKEVAILNIIVFEDDQGRRDSMEKVIVKSKPEACIVTFATSDMLLEFAKKTNPEVAFISIESADGRGYFTVKALKKISPKTNVIVIASQCRYMQELIHLRISGYVTGELTKDIVTEELANLRY